MAFFVPKLYTDKNVQSQNSVPKALPRTPKANKTIALLQRGETKEVSLSVEVYIIVVIGKQNREDTCEYLGSSNVTERIFILICCP